MGAQEEILPPTPTPCLELPGAPPEPPGVQTAVVGGFGMHQGHQDHVTKPGQVSLSAIFLIL